MDWDSMFLFETLNWCKFISFLVCPWRNTGKPLTNIEHHGLHRYIGYIHILGDGFLSLHLDHFQNTGNLRQSCGPQRGSPFQGPKNEFLCKGVNWKLIRFEWSSFSKMNDILVWFQILYIGPTKAPCSMLIVMSSSCLPFCYAHARARVSVKLCASRNLGDGKNLEGFGTHLVKIWR